MRGKCCHGSRNTKYDKKITNLEENTLECSKASICTSKNKILKIQPPYCKAPDFQNELYRATLRIALPEYEHRALQE